MPLAFDSFPPEYKHFIDDKIGDTVKVRGAVFSRKSLPEAEYTIYDIRMSHRFIMNIKTRDKYPAFELLLKNDSMDKKRWSLPFPIRQVNLKR